MSEYVLRKDLQHRRELPATPTCRRWEDAGILPRPIQLSERIFAYRSDEYQAFKAARLGTTPKAA
jgi:hypothetical protein